MVQSNLDFTRSYVRTEEYDLTQQVSATDGTVGYVQGQFHRGSALPTYTSPTTFYNLYGPTSDPSIGFAWDTSSIFLNSSANLLIQRVTNNALYAGLDVILDDDATYGKRVLVLPFMAGSEVGYDKSGLVNTAGVSEIKFSAKLVTANVFAISITDGETATPISVTFSTDNNTTMTAIALAIEGAMQAYSPTEDGECSVYMEPSSPIADRLTILIRPPHDATLDFSTPTVTLGATQPTVKFVDADTNWLFTMFAENQGIWADNYGGILQGIDQGTRARYRIAFAGPLITANSVVININGVNTTPVVFATDSDTTMAAIAAAIAANSNILSATVEEVAGAINNDRSIMVVAKNPGVAALTISNPVITGGASQTVGIVTQTLTGVDSTGALTLAIYNNSTVNFPVETYTFTLFKQVNGNGDQIYFDSIVNQGPGSSINVRVVGNPALNTATLFAPVKTKLLDPAMVYRDTVAWMNGGDDGDSVTTGQMISALTPITDRVRYPLNIIMAAGYTDISYMQALVSLCEQRGDTTAILDMPQISQLAQDAYNFRQFELDIDSSYGAIYTPNCQITDISTGEDRYIPPSGLVGAAYVYNDSVRNRYAAPAGLNRGVLRQAKGLLVEYTPQDLDLMNPVGINAIVNKKATGPTIMSEQTLQVANSARSSIHIRRTLNLVKTTLSDSLEYSLFEPNTEATRFAVTQLAESVLGPAKQNDGLYDYLIQCDSDNNTPDVEDKDVMICDIYVKPVRVAKGILLRTFVTRTGVSFQEVIAQFTL